MVTKKLKIFKTIKNYCRNAKKSNRYLWFIVNILMLENQNIFNFFII